jgi:hypothetical protein
MKQTTTRMLFSYWDGLRGERAAPERGEIEPGAIRHVLPDAFILELGPDRSARVRLAGTRLCALFGGELKGRAFETLWSEPASRDIRRSLEAVVEETAGMVVGLVGATARGDRLDLEMLLLPLRHRGRTHTRILGALAPAVVPPWLGFEALSTLAIVSMRVLSASRGAIAAEPVPEASLPLSDAVVSAERTAGIRRFVVYEGGRA